jgi:eukaryotic-like serine/threonine-protein kinase
VLGEILQDTYRVERLIGKGGMGAVYEASHLRLTRSFAIKVLAPHLAQHPEAVARFRQEAEIASSLGHPHILQVIDFNYTPDGQPYLIMDLLDGENLGKRLQRQRPLGLGPAITIFEQTASALQAVHDRGIVHRDLKPANIFLSPDGRTDTFVRVLDFGISKVLGSEGMTKANAILGTAYYMSPEQASGQSALVDARCDIYSLGVIVFEMIAGRPPFIAEDMRAMLRQIVHKAPPTLRSLGSGAPVELDDVIRRALEKSPAARWPSMDAFWSAFAERSAAVIGRRGTPRPDPVTPSATVMALEETQLPPELSSTPTVIIDDGSPSLLATSPRSGPSAAELAAVETPQLEPRTATLNGWVAEPSVALAGPPRNRRPLLLLSLVVATAAAGGIAVSWILLERNWGQATATAGGGPPDGELVRRDGGRRDQTVDAGRRDSRRPVLALDGAPEPDRAGPSRPEAGLPRPIVSRPSSHPKRPRPAAKKPAAAAKKPGTPAPRDWIIEPKLD